MFHDCAAFDVSPLENNNIFLSDSYVASFNISEADYTSIPSDTTTKSKIKTVMRFKDTFFCEDAITLEQFKLGIIVGFSIRGQICQK